jgi:16S rRNA (uracil1498-N3)-methyltransferase
MFKDERGEESPSIILLQSLPKGDKMDLIVRQAAETGISKIIPFVSEFSIGKANVGEKKFTRWERIIKEARQQSGSRIDTNLQLPLAINEVFDFWREIKDEAIGLLFHQQGVEKNSLHGYLKGYPKIVVMAVGPEGGFSDAEVSLFIENDFKALTIGDTILRTETAALYCAAAIKIILLERDTWKLNKIQSKQMK